MGNYKKALAGLNDAQKKAVTTIDGPVLVIAGPGTGKTQLLATRIAHILATTDTLPENILCLTFTDSAAHNMRERLSGMIGQAAYKVTISTYHAFGSDLIKRFRDYFAADGELEPIDDLGIDQAFRDIISQLPYGNPLKYGDSFINDIKAFVSEAKRALLQPDDLRALAKQNQDFINSVQPVIAQALEGFTRMGGNSVSKFENIANSLPPLPDLSGETRLPLGHMFAVSLHDALAKVAESGKTTALTKWKDAWLIKDGDGKFIADGTKTNQKLLALADVYEAYLKHLANQQLFDYDDMILRAVNALHQNDDLRFTLQEQYLYILLDEFQDTNDAQLRLVELLTDNPVLEGRPNILAVGDDDQAIYAFQGADYSHMLQFQRLYRDVLLVPLTQNYRSHADVLHVARGIAEQIEERLHHHFPSIEKTLTASNPNLPTTAIIERHEAASEAGQFTWVAEQINKAIQNGTPAHEIAVLAPKHKYLEPLVSYLQEKQIPIRYDKREDILDDPAIVQLLRMSELVVALQAGQFASANALWAEVLSYSFWQLPTSLVWQLSWQATDDNQNWTETLLQNDACKPIALFFMRLSMVAQTETLETMLDYLIGSAALDLQEPDFNAYTSPFYDYYFGDINNQSQDILQLVGSFWDLLSNLTVLRSRLQDFKREQQEPLKLADFNDFAHAHRAAGIKILNTSPYQNDDDAVQLMTAFKAKGMEFGTVFVLAVNDEAWGDSARKQSSRLSLPANLQYIRYAGATPDERLRLFYVAVTRAKTALYLVNYTQNFSGKVLNRLRYLNEVFEDGHVITPLLPASEQTVQHIPTPNLSDRTQTIELSSFWQQRHQLALTKEHDRSLLRARLQTFQLSPTHVNSFIDLEHAGPLEFFMSTILRFPKAPDANGQFGNAIHETLEWLHVQNKTHGKVPGLEATLNYFERRLTLKKLTPQDTIQLLARGQEALQTYLAQRLHTIHSHNECERNFRHEGIFIGSAHMTGKIDKLIIDKQQHTITIVDYKTGKSHAKWDSSVKLHKYRQQLYLYRALIEQTRGLVGYKVTDTYLEFVEPDENGKIQELHLIFNDEEYQATKELAKAIWQHIQTIILPNATPYSADMRGVSQFESHLIAELQTIQPSDSTQQITLL